jgi:gliding motility-associated-like protein
MATNIPVDGSCQTFNNTDATFDLLNGDCSSPADNNVWFSFVAGDPDYTVSISSPDPSFSPQVALISFDPTPCDFASATQLNCGVNISGTGLVIGQTYHLIVTSAINAFGTFDLCLDNNSAPLPGPANDIVCNAEVVTPDGSCVVGTTIDATLDIPDAGCGGPAMVEVWYSITLAPGSDELTIDLSNLSIPGNGILLTNLYTFPSCVSFFPTLIPGATYCGGPGPLNFVVTGLTGGQTYYFQVGTTAFNSGNFSVCFTEDGPLPCPTGGSVCNGAEQLIPAGPPIILCTSGCNTGAMTGPIGNGGCFDFPNETTWYYYNPIPVTGGGAPWNYTITVTSDDLNDPQVAIFQNCPGLTPVACGIGANGIVEVDFDSEDFPIDVYFIAVSDANGASGQYDLCVEPYGYTDCATEASINIISTSLGSPLLGPYLPSEEVEVCLNIDNFNSGEGTGCNFFHGLKPQFGDGWDFNASFLSTGEPSNITVPLTNNTQVGNWQWFSGFASPTYNLPNGNYPQGSPVGVGWFYIRNPTQACTVPGCSLGDGIDPMLCTNGNNMSWQVCFVLTVKPYPQCSLPPEFPSYWDNSDLSISFETFSDGETGANPNPGCWEDGEWSLDLTVNCCAPPIMNPEPLQSFCETGTVNFPLVSDLDPNVEYTWTVSPNNVGATACSSGCPNMIDQVLTNNSLNAETVTYTVTPFSTLTGCVGGQFEYSVTVNAPPQLTMAPAIPVCPGSCTNLNTTVVGGQGNIIYSWVPGAFGSNPQVCPLQTTMYQLTVTDASGCSDSDSVLVEIYPNPIVEIVPDPDQTEICENDPNYPIEVSAMVTNGGSGVFFYDWGSNGSGLQTIDAEISDFYSVTVTDLLTQCSGESIIQIIVHPAPVATITEPDTICGGLGSYCFMGAPDGGVWESDDISIDIFGCIVPTAETPGIKNICYSYTDNFTQCDSTICIDITIAPFPSLETPNDTIVCDTFILPVIQGTNLTGNEAYYDQSGGMGNSFSAGDVISSSIQLFIYTDDGSGLCGDEVSFDITLGAGPLIDDIPDVNNCDSYSLPLITGSNLTGNEAFYDAPGGTGNIYSDGDVISSSILMYIFDSDNGCTDEQSFQIDINIQPEIDAISDVTECNQYTLTAITGTNLTGNQVYFDQPGGIGTQYQPGDIISSSITLYAYDDSSNGNCSDEVTFDITILDQPDLDPIGDEEACNSYTLQPITGTNLTGNEAYFDQSGGNGTQYQPGDIISNSITLYAYDETTLQGCLDEESFQITIIDQPLLDPISDIIACDEYTLLPISGANLSGNESYYDQPNGGGNQFNPGDIINITTSLYVYDETGLAGCSDENEFLITINPTPESDFSLPTTICISDFATISYTGTATPGATYNWNFDSGNILSGSGQGPYEIEWNTSGNYNISLTVEENGCISPISQQTIIVDPELSLPIINCNSTTTEIEFTWANVNGASSYNVIVLNGPNGILNGNTYTVSGLNPGEIVEIQVEAIGNSICGSSNSTLSCTAQDCPPIVINIDPVNDICYDNTSLPINLIATVSNGDGSGSGSWSGNFISPTGTFDIAAAGPGNHVLVYTFDEAGCTFNESITVNIYQTPVADFTVTPVICEGGNAIIVFTGTSSINAIYNWNFNGGTIVSGSGQGPYEISWANSGTYNVMIDLIDNGCNSNTAMLPVQVDQPLLPPVINCNSTAEQIEFSWGAVTGASSYIVNVISGPTGTQSGNTYTVTGLLANDQVTIEVIAVNNGPCGNSSSTQTCSALDCPAISISIDPVNDICLDGNNNAFNLNAIVTGSNGSGSGIWSPSDVVDPIALGAGVHSFVYTFDEVGCTFNETIDIIIFQTPVADFSVTPVICEGDNATIAFTGTASLNAVFNWNFNGGTIVSGSGQGPYEISWANSGTYNVTLDLIDNGCNSNTASLPVQVDQPLLPPVINCNSTAEQIEFSWGAVTGASSYIVNVISGPAGTQSGNTYTITGLLANDQVTIEVIAVNNGPCGNSSSTQTCSALDCPSISITIDPVNDICLDGNNNAFNLNAIVTGSNGSGSGTWSPSDLVDPIALGAGVHSFAYTFDEAGCTFNEAIDINIFQTPVANFIVSSDICQGNNATITFNGSASLTANYNWDFNGGTIISGSGQGPYEILWANPGNYSISLEVLENGCNSNFASMPIEVHQPLPNPLIDCNATTQQIEFTWDDIPGAAGYTVNVISGPAGIQSGNSYTISGLQANDEVTIEVIAIDNGPCPNSSSIQTCMTMDCPVISINIDPVNSICLDSNTNSFALNANITGSDGSGSGTWSPQGFVDPVSLGSGVHVFVYTFEEVGCMYSESIQITINDLPNAEAGNTNELSCTINEIQLNGSGSANGANIDVLWSGPGNILNDQTLTPTVNLPGTYYISVLDNNTGCSSIDSVEITQDDSVPIALAGPDSSLTCNFPNIQLQGGGSMGIDFEYEWQGPGINNSNINEINPEISTAGTYVLIVTNVTNGCASFADTVIILDNTQEPIVVVDPIGATDLDCNNQSIILDGTGSTTTNVTYEWLDPNGNIIPGENSIDYETSIAGSYTLVVTNIVTGCSNSASYEIQNNTAFPVADAGLTQQLDCTISTVTLDGSLSDSGPTISYLWEGPIGGISGNNTTPVISAILPGVYVLTVSNSFNGCTSSAIVNVSENLNGPVADAGSDVELDCDFNSISLNGENSSTGTNFSYEWVDPNGEIISTDIIANTNELGTYLLIVTDENNDCIDTSFVAVLENSNVPSSADLSVSIPSCYGEDDGSIIVNSISGGTMPYIYSLDGNDFTTLNQFNNLESGEYTLSIEDAGGCQWDSVFIIGSPIEVTLNLGEDIRIHLGEQADIDAITSIAGGLLDTIIWSPMDLLNCLDSSCLHITTNILRTTSFNATISDINGCTDTDDITVYVRWDDLIYVPNTFTPNDDGFNDIFMVYGGLGITKINEFRVFDRWGEIVFQQYDFQPNDPVNSWDGRFRGEDLTPQVFVYYLEVLLDNGNVELISGDVTLVK